MASNASWGADTVVSLPAAPDETPIRSAGTGFGFSRFGLVHDITPTDVEGFLTPTFSPIEAPERG